MQRLLGKLSYVAARVPPGRPFLVSLINALSSIETRSSKMEISSDIMDDLQWWRLFLGKYNGISIFLGQSIIDSVELFSTDACRSGPRGGCGAILLHEFFHTQFPDFIAKMMSR